MAFWKIRKFLKLFLENKEFLFYKELSHPCKILIFLCKKSIFKNLQNAKAFCLFLQFP